MKNFLPADLTRWWLLESLRPPGPKNVIPGLWTWSRSCSWRIFFSPIRASWCLLESFPPPEPKNVWFLLSRHDVGRVHEKFSSRRFDEMMAVRFTSASWAQKRLIPTFHTWCTSSWWKIFFSPIPSSWWLIESFRSREPKNGLIPTF